QGCFPRRRAGRVAGRAAGTDQRLSGAAGDRGCTRARARTGKETGRQAEAKKDAKADAERGAGISARSGATATAAIVLAGLAETRHVLAVMFSRAALFSWSRNLTENRDPLFRIALHELHHRHCRPAECRQIDLVQSPRWQATGFGRRSARRHTRSPARA